MEEKTRKKLKQDIDFGLCIQCQKLDTTDLVTQPSLNSYIKFLDYINKREQYGDVDYQLIRRRLENFTAADLQTRNAKWHRKCYQSTCHSGHLARAKSRYEKVCKQDASVPFHKGVEHQPSGSTSTSTESESRFTRSATKPFNASLCFFCQEDKKATLHEVSTFNVGEKLKKIVEESSNQKWKVQLSSAIDTSDARAIDVKYHLPCWVKNVQRASKKSDEDTGQILQEKKISIVAADTEFISLVSALLRTGKVLNITDLKSSYSEILESNGVYDIHPSTQGLKEKITSQISDVHFMKSKRKNESDRVFTTAVRDAAIEDALEQSVTEEKIRHLFESASLLRGTISSQAKHPWQFEGELSTTDVEKHVPKLLYSFIRWLIEGPATGIQDGTVRSAGLHRDVLGISQNIMYCWKSRRQVTYKPKEQNTPFRRHLECPHQLAVGIAVHQSTRSKKLIEFLHGFGQCVDYSRILRLETQLANTVLEATREQGAYLPATMRKGAFIFFAVDNSDFNEDTPDGKRTLHATATAVFQRQELTKDLQHDRMKLRLHNVKARDRTLKNLQTPHLISCYPPNIQGARGSTFSDFNPGSTRDFITPYTKKDTVWLLSRAMMRATEDKNVSHIQETLCDEAMDTSPLTVNEELSLHDQGLQKPTDVLQEQTGVTRHTTPVNETIYHNIPKWAAYNSLLSSSKLLTEVCALPLIPSPAHEWQTLLTVLKQTQQINCTVMGPDKKTVITLDMALYERAKQLEMTRDDCKGQWVLRLGEMHTVMAALRAAGNIIEDSGFDDAWIEADIYGPTTTRQILEAKHMKRALQAHITTVQALYDLYVEEFFREHPHLKDPCFVSAQRINNSCGRRDQEEMLQAEENMLNALESNKVLEAMVVFKERKEVSNPLFKFVMGYMHMISLIYTFIRATRDGIWELHLSSLDMLCKYFFALDKQKYARLVPLYLADMSALETTDPDIYEEFINGNFSVHKNIIPFCAVGVDHALEHINRVMKVTGGLVGITQNASARERFFLTAPELSRLAEEAHHMAGSSTSTRTEHHDLSNAVWSREERNILKLKNVICASMNPMTYDGGDLPNIITKVVMPSEVQHDLCLHDEIGQEKYVAFVQERIRTNEVSIWSRMKKTQLKLWKSVRKTVTHKQAEQAVELKDDRSLFARMLIVARSRPELDVKEAIGQYEFTALPRALFSISGTLLPCSDKSSLMTILETLPKQDLHEYDQQPQEITMDEVVQPVRKVTVIDGMALVQALGKPAWIKTCAQWAEYFNTALDKMSGQFEEVHLVFDRYDLPISLKESTRERRQGSKPAITYHVEDQTPVGKVSTKQFLSSTATKDELTVYLAHKAVMHFEGKSTVFIATSRQDVYSNSIDVKDIQSSQEEADTKIILHCLNAVKRGATQLYIQSPDTDVFIIAIYYYQQFCKDTYFVTGIGHKKRTIQLAPIVNILGVARVEALPGFHALTGADQTGRFAGKGKLSCWQALNRCPPRVLCAFAALGASNNLSAETESAMELFVCQLYQPGTATTTVRDLRWRLFSRKQLEAQKLPPTKGALHEAVCRAQFQAMVWHQAHVPNPKLPSATDYGWRAEGSKLVPITTKIPPAPAAVSNLIKCGCKKTNCRTHCTCRSQGLNCSEMCNCGADEDVCSNTEQEKPLAIDDDEEEDEISDLLI